MAYEHSGPAGGSLFTSLFADARPRSDFVWRTRIGDADLALPVVAEFKRSWADALLWRWRPVLPMRAFYEWYLDERRFSGSDVDPHVFLDIGANDGMITYPFAAYGWRCIAFEPQDSCIRHMGEVCRLNGFNNVTTVQSVVTATESANVDFFVSRSSWYSSLSREQVEQFEPAHKVTLPAVTLDSFVGEHQLAPRCIKIDVEGAEGEVLQGARQTLERVRPELVVEVLSDASLRRRIWDLLTPLEYRFFVLTSSRRQPLRRLEELEDFVVADAEHGHGDFVLIADAELNTRIGALAGLL